MTRWTIVCILWGTAFGISPSGASGTEVSGNIRRVGLFGKSGVPKLRTEEWTFVEVELRSNDATPLAGELRVRQPDQDGDVVVSTTPIVLAPNGETRPFEVYFVPRQSSQGQRLRVELVDESGAVVPILDDNLRESVKFLESDEMLLNEHPSEDYYILDISARSLPHLEVLEVANKSSGSPERSDEPVNFRRVRDLPASELPGHWQGLASIDAIVWDDADPSSLSRQQIDALVGWVKAGGRLLITASHNWQTLAGSALAAVLPASITGAGTVNEALEFADIVGQTEYESQLGLDRSYDENPIMRCQLSPHASAIPIPEKCDLPRIAFRRQLGRGTVTMVGASLRQLLPPPKQFNAQREYDEPFGRVCERVIGQNFLCLPAVSSEPNPNFNAGQDLFAHVRTTIGFDTVGNFFFLFAMLFATGYTAFATFGSYWFLKRRGWLHHCWTVFAAVSVVGSVIGTAMVWSLRGVTKQLWQTSVVDARAGIDHAHASCLFGVKTPEHSRLGLRLPVASDSGESTRRYGPIRGIAEPQTGFDGSSGFGAKEEYRAVLAGCGLDDVPIRATLKEFEGEWSGPIGGTLDGKFVLKSFAGETRTGKVTRTEFANSSYLRNGLGFDLRDCYIIWTKKPSAALDKMALRCHSLGEFPATGPNAELDGQTIRHRLFFQPRSKPDEEPKRLDTSEFLLENFSKSWRRNTASLTSLDAYNNEKTTYQRVSHDQAHSALLLLSMFDQINRNSDNAFSRSSLRRGHGRPWGCLHLVTERTALLIGFSDVPPPARLEVDGRPLSPAKSLTMYRFVIPVEP